VLFALLLAAFYAITFVPYLNMQFLPAFQVVNAKASATLMNLLGEGATVRQTTISSARYSVNIAHGCDAIEPIALFVAAVLAFPARLRSKVPGLLAGIAALCLLNLVRIISLFYTGVHWPKWFEIMHIDVWQPAFVVFSLFFWVVWALWATKPLAKSENARP
jgi:exosortase family protein XrtM